MGAQSGEVVLVGGGQTIGALGAVRALQEAGHVPWVAVQRRNAYAARSRAAAGVVEVPDPAGDERGFVSCLADAALRIHASVVLPGNEVELIALSRHRDGFATGVALGVCSLPIVERAIDKTVLAELGPAAGLPVPPTVRLRLSEVGDPLPFAYPVVVKPLQSNLRTAAGAALHFTARRVNSPMDLRAAVAAFPNERALVQPYLQGPIGSLAGVFWNGEMVCAVQSRSERIWPPYCGSMTYAVTIPLDQRLTASCGNLLRAVGWNGLFQIDFVERAGQSLLIDLNPRFYTSLAITTRAGVNLPAVWVDLLRGRYRKANHSYAVGVGYRHDEDDIRALIGMLLRGPRGAALRGLLPRRRTAHPVFSLRDPLPSLTTLGKFVQRVSTCVPRFRAFGRGSGRTVRA